MQKFIQNVKNFGANSCCFLRTTHALKATRRAIEPKSPRKRGIIKHSGNMGWGKIIGQNIDPCRDWYKIPDIQAERKENDLKFILVS